MAKGSNFEREVCKQLSLWWSKDKRDDIFWRTAGSGAMAKTRSKSNRKTFGQYGDIQATDPIGQPLIDLVSIELKRGYSKSTFADLIDRPKNAAEQMYESFIHQAIQDYINSSAQSWWLIVKRDRREPIIITPFSFSIKLRNAGSLIRRTSPSFFLYTTFHNNSNHKLFGTTLDNFLNEVTPKHIIKIGE